MALKQAAERSVKIDIVSTSESIARLKVALPNLLKYPKVNLFRPRSEMATDSVLGSHAKVFIADESYGYIGSANLTDTGLLNNLEMGVVVRGPIAQAATVFWLELERLGFLEHVEK
jgi:phosphatidylserine/phosphatidylglycerophosphate/cardiolipin synthase-like enzyme